MAIKNQSGKQTKLMSMELREFIFNNPDSTVVYYLPEDHYVGIARNKNFWRRLHQHRSAGNYTYDVDVIAFYERRVDAHLLETRLHTKGYAGFSDLTNTINNKVL